MSQNGWIGVDLDGTLAVYDDWISPTHIGEPVPLMVDRVKKWLSEGFEVRIFTARVYTGHPEEVSQRAGEAYAAKCAIEDWSAKHLGVVLPITCTKDYDMIELWDDRAVTVQKNTGRQLSDSTRGLD